MGAIEGSGPSAWSDAAIVYDLYLDQTVLFGGINGTNDGLGDTWVYEDGQWRNVVLTGGLVPIQNRVYEQIVETQSESGSLSVSGSNGASNSAGIDSDTDAEGHSDQSERPILSETSASVIVSV